MQIGEAKLFSGMSRRIIRRLLGDGDVDGYQTPGGHWRVSRESLQDYMAHGKKEALAISRSLGL